MNKEIQNGKRIKRTKSIIFYIALILVSFIFIYPLIYTIMSSLKNNNEIYSNYFGLPTVFRYENYKDALNTGNMGKAFVNSLLLTLITISGQLLFSAMAAFALTRVRFKLNYPLLIFFSLGMMIPIQSILIPIATLAAKFHLSDSYVGLLAVYIGGGIPSCVFIIAGFMKSLPKELEEAAIIDGCNINKIFWLIDLPLSVPAIVTMGIMAFLGTWNELIVALVLIKQEALKTLPMALLSFNGQFSVKWGMLCAAIVIAIIPTVTVYTLLQNKVERGLSEGAVKG